MHINSRDYYRRLRRQREKLLLRLQVYLAQAYMANLPKPTLDRISALCKRVESSAQVYACLECLPL
jgi:hypothetical protein